MAKEVLGRDINGAVDFTLPPPIECQTAVLTANVINTKMAPAGFNRVFFSPSVGTDVMVTLEGTDPEFVDGSDVLQELNPAGRQLSGAGGETIKLLCPTASTVTLRFDQGQ